MIATIPFVAIAKISTISLAKYISKYNTNSPILQIKRGTFTTKPKGFDPKITKKEDDIKLTYNRH
jgi:hypothetical protein